MMRHFFGDGSRMERTSTRRRLALGLKGTRKPRNTRKTVPSGKAEQIAHFIGEHHLEAITLNEIAASVGLNANYAATIFKQTFSMTILEYLTQHRVAHAQRLLATSNRGVLEVAFESGFGSSSQFYVAF
jgi:AraC family transcriptional regulator, melibiose operon regulatory protein